VKRIEDATGARVKCLTDKTTVEVSGSSEAVRRASDMIIDILESHALPTLETVDVLPAVDVSERLLALRRERPTK